MAPPDHKPMLAPQHPSVGPDTRRVELFRRNERQNFELVDQTGHAELVLDSVGLRLPTTEVFDGAEDGGT